MQEVKQLCFACVRMLIVKWTSTVEGEVKPTAIILLCQSIGSCNGPVWIFLKIVEELVGLVLVLHIIGNVRVPYEQSHSQQRVHFVANVLIYAI